MKKSVKAVLLVLSAVVGMGVARAGLKDFKLQKPETVQVSGVVKVVQDHTLVVLVQDGKNVAEQSFLLGTFTQIKGAKSKGIEGLVPGKLVNVMYDPKDAQHTARVVAIVEKGEKQKQGDAKPKE